MGLNIFHVAVALLAMFETCSALPLPLPQPGATCMVNYCPTYFASFPPRARRSPTPTIDFKTNAQRLVERIPLKPPMFRVRNASPWKRAPPPRVSVLPRPSPNVQHCGVVVLKNDTGGRVGYISKTVSPLGYVVLNETVKEAVTVCFMSREGRRQASNVTLSFKNWSSGDDFPLLGLMQGKNKTDSDIGPGNPNYLTVVGVEGPATPPGSPPALGNNTFSSQSGLEREVETSVWSINLRTGDLTTQWTNPNGTLRTTHLFSVDNVLHAGGDPDASVANASAIITPLALHFIQW